MIKSNQYLSKITVIYNIKRMRIYEVFHPSGTYKKYMHGFFSIFLDIRTLPTTNRCLRQLFLV